MGHTGGPETFFSRLVQSGTHLQSMALVAAGMAAAATVDSNALNLELRRKPDLVRRLRVVEEWGPSPIQPLLARAHLDPEVKTKVIEALLALHESDALRRRLAGFGVIRFAPVAEVAYEALAAVPKR